MVNDIILSASFGWALFWTATWLMLVWFVTVQKVGKISFMQTFLMSSGWAIYHFFLLQK
jgi:hypothetical protein